MTDDMNPIRELATDSATNAVPLKLDGRPDFAVWADAVDVVAGDIRATLEAEVQA
jgi:hypothetical protein